MTGFEEFMMSRQTFDGIRILMLLISSTLLIKTSYRYMTLKPIREKPKFKVRKTKQKVSEILSS